MKESGGEPRGTHLEAEAKRLAAPEGLLRLPIPAYSGSSLPNLAVTVAQAAGLLDERAPPLSPPLVPNLDPFHSAPAPGTVVLFLVDGLGWLSLVDWAANATEPGAERFLRASQPITSVFPTTTTTALASLSTGTPPARHGLVGYRQYLPRFGVVADLLKMSPVGSAIPELLVGPEWKPEYVSGAPSLFRRGLSAVAVSRDKFQGTGFTRVLYDGAEYAPYATAADFAHTLLEILTRKRPPPVIYAYWDELDTIQHLKGPTPALFDFEMSRLIHLIAFVAKHLDAKARSTTTLLLTGDHGQVSTEQALQIRIDQEQSIVQEMARPLAGDRRAGYFVARPGRREALENALKQRMPLGSKIVPMEEALSAGLFGSPPYHPEVVDRLGDFLVLVPSPHGLQYLPPGFSVPKRHLHGGHGGLEPEELLVPLSVLPLTDWV